MNKKALLLSILLTLSPLSHADLLGIEDTQMIALSLKQLNELQEQYRILRDTYQSAQAQVENLNQLKSMNSGHYGFGDLKNGLDSLQSWQSSVSTWQDALQNLSGGNSSRYKELVEKNELNRYSLGTKNLENMKYNNDGSLTLYIQENSPGKDKEPNWLPTPNGEFEMTIRTYWPKEIVNKGGWSPPAVVQIN